VGGREQLYRGWIRWCRGYKKFRVRWEGANFVDVGKSCGSVQRRRVAGEHVSAEVGKSI
jgi:hypothetical protein